MSAKRLALSLLAPMLVITACSNNDNPIGGKTPDNAPAVSQGAPLIIDPAALTLEVGKSQKLSALFNQDGTIKRDLPTTWTSQDQQIASVDSSGNVTALKPGNVRIEATTLGTKATTLLTIVAAGSAPTTPTTQPSANPSTSPSPCPSPAAGATACIQNENSANPLLAKLRTIVVRPENESVQPTLFKFSRLGETKKFVAVGKDSEAQDIPSLTFKWSSSDEKVATVNSTGVVTAVATGTTNLIADAGNVKSNIIQLVVQEGTIRAHIRFME